MVERKPLQSLWPAALDITLVPAVARLSSSVFVERRDLAGRHRLLRRVHGEFEEMPGLMLTVAQAAKFFGLRADTTSRILKQLSDARVLRQRSDGQFALHG
jgi:hypothetical protein